MTNSIRNYLELVKFSHTVFALPFCLIAAILAWDIGRNFHWLQVVGILGCMVTARTAAMAFNRLVDSSYDKENPRTANRHLPAGILQKTQVWAFFALAVLGFLAFCGVFLILGNPWPLIFGLPTLAFLLGYSFTKRFTALCHFWLGLALALSPLGAWVAIRGMAWTEIPIPLMLTGGVLFWVAGFDILYACQDLEFDRQAGLSSIPSRWGIKIALRGAFFSHLVTLGFLWGLYQLAHPPLGWVYLAGVGGVGFLILVQHSLVRENDLSKINQAFFLVNAIISIGLLLVVATQCWLIPLIG